MSLYRTWRPKSFTDLVGQEAVVRTLRTALEQGRLAHAYLFSGPRGSGKTSAAKILARCIDCRLGPTPEPDNTCEFCREMLAGTALDVLEIDAASNRGIDEIRALRDSAKFAPSQMRSKVFIIDEAHMLTREGANAFLKTLEEPPSHVVFILATTAPEALPPTILSRCQRYAFRRIPVATMIERMRTIADAEGIAIDDDALGAIAYRADGGLRDALTMLEQVAAFAGDAATIGAAAVDAAFGTTGRAYARTLVRAIVAGDALAGLRAVSEASDAGADLLGLIRGATAEYRHLLVARVDPALLATDLSPSDAQEAVDLARSTPQPKIVRGLRLLADAASAGRLSGNPRLELETALLRLIATADDPTLEALASRLAVLEEGLVGGGPSAIAQSAARELAPVMTPVAAPPKPPALPPPKPAVALQPKPAPPEPKPAAALAPTAPQSNAGTASPEVLLSQPSTESVAGPGLSAVRIDRHESPATAISPLRGDAGDDDVPPPGDDDDPSLAAPTPSVMPPVTATTASATTAAAAPAAATPAGGEPAVPPSLQQVRSRWESIRMRLCSERASLNIPLSRTMVLALDGDVLTVGVPNATMESLLRDNQPALEASIFGATGAKLRVAFKIYRGETAAAVPAGRPRAATAPARSETPSLRAVPNPPSESTGESDGELGLLDYARKTIGGTDPR